MRTFIRVLFCTFALLLSQACRPDPKPVVPVVQAVSQPSLAEIKGLCLAEYEKLQKPDSLPGMLKKTTMAQRHAAAAAMSRREGLSAVNAKTAEFILDSMAQNE